MVLYLDSYIYSYIPTHLHTIQSYPYTLYHGIPSIWHFYFLSLAWKPKLVWFASFMICLNVIGYLRFPIILPSYGFLWQILNKKFANLSWFFWISAWFFLDFFGRYLIKVCQFVRASNLQFCIKNLSYDYNWGVAGETFSSTSQEIKTFPKLKPINCDSSWSCSEKLPNMPIVKLCYY